ncbi:Uma2 family endonuclease [Sphingomonas suaedae]|uniref:Uma2 family endonuclease n=1 Tax=Sphingomonas suaedae TaxID=2599297 RepID=A0A518RBW8_9SPHN|nr:Uma2 family endonuclease [Sphingomonas suaedae]QDX24943.1 Uma2 family endonuclease [Sphingomonas suaedae]
MTAQDVLQSPHRYRLRVADYLALAKSGAFEGMQTELIAGDVIVMSPEFRPHWYAKSELGYQLRKSLELSGSRLFSGDEGSVALSDNDMPRPDIIVTDEPRGDGPIPLASVRLLVEVSSSTSATDKGLKAELYAGHEIPEYWVADVDDRTIHQMWSPIDGSYAEQREIAFGDAITAATIAGLTVATATL